MCRVAAQSMPHLERDVVDTARRAGGECAVEMIMKHRLLDLDLNDPEMIEARRQLGEKIAAQREVEKYWERRLADAREMVAPDEAVGFCFIPRPSRFQVRAITQADLTPGSRVSGQRLGGRPERKNKT